MTCFVISLPCFCLVLVLELSVGFIATACCQCFLATLLTGVCVRAYKNLSSVVSLILVHINAQGWAMGKSVEVV